MGKKETYYFPHDFDPTGDPKIQALIGEYGAVGYGVYWRIVEMLHANSEHKLPHKDYIILAIAKQMQANVQQIEAMLKHCIMITELFVSDGDFFWSDRVNRNISDRRQLSEIRSVAGKAGAIAKQTKANAKQNQAKERKGKESKIKEIKEKKIKKAVFSFEKVPFDFLKIVETWIGYKAERKEGYKSQTSFDAMISKLIRESGNSPEVALQMIENAMANNWQGFFPINEQRQRSFNHTPSVTAEIDELTAEYNSGRITEEEYLKRKA